MSAVVDNRIFVREPLLGDAAWIAKHIGDKYAKEIELSCGMSPEASIQWSINDSVFCRVAHTADYPAKPIAVFGVCRKFDQPQVGVPWYIGTKHETGIVRSMQILRYARDYICMMGNAGPFRSMENYVLAENHSSLCFIEWLGFELQDAEPWGPYGALFHKFEAK